MNTKTVWAITGVTVVALALFISGALVGQQKRDYTSHLREIKANLLDIAVLKANLDRIRRLVPVSGGISIPETVYDPFTNVVFSDFDVYPEMTAKSVEDVTFAMGFAATMACTEVQVNIDAYISGLEHKPPHTFKIAGCEATFNCLTPEASEKKYAVWKGLALGTGHLTFESKGHPCFSPK